LKQADCIIRSAWADKPKSCIVTWENRYGSTAVVIGRPGRQSSREAW
jgi:hypothetical protein